MEIRPPSRWVGKKGKENTEKLKEVCQWHFRGRGGSMGASPGKTQYCISEEISSIKRKCPAFYFPSIIVRLERALEN